MPEGMPNHVTDRQLQGRIRENTRLQPNAVRLRNLQLERVLDNQQPVFQGEDRDQRVEERRLAGTGTTGNEDVATRLESMSQDVENGLRKRTHADEVRGLELRPCQNRRIVIAG